MSRTPAALAQASVATLLAAFVVVPLTAPAVPAAHAAASQRHELTDRRTQRSVTYANPDGSLTTTLFAAPVNYRDAHGRWHPIDSRLVPAQTAGYAYRNAANGFDALFKGTSAPGYLRLLVGGTSLDVGLRGAAARPARSSGHEIVYPGLFDGVDLRYDLGAQGLKETLVLGSANAPTHYEFTLAPTTAARLSAKRLPSGGWAFVAPHHAGPLLELAPPRVDDSAATTSSAPRAGKRGPRSAVTLDVKRTGDSFALDLAVDARWLRAPERQFPVLLDPSITIQPAVQTGDFIGTCPDCSDDGSPLWIGASDTDTWRAAVQFDLADLPPASTISSATLGLWNDAASCVYTTSGTCGSTSHTINAYRMTKAWDTWEMGGNTTTSQLGWDATALSSYPLAKNAASGWMNWSVTSTVQSWSNGTQPNYGFLLESSTEALNSGGPAPPGADADDPAQAPKLDVTYTSDAVKLYPPDTVHSNGADLHWSPYAYPDGHPFQGYEIHRSQTPNFTPSASTLIATIGDPAVTAYRDTTAAAGKAFTYKVVVNGWPSYERTVTLPADGYATKSLQVGPDGSDTHIESFTGDTNCENYGDDAYSFIGDDTDGYTPPNNSLYRSLLQFDVRDIPADATITSATLSLHTALMPPAGQVTVGVHRVTSAWQEGSGLGGCTGDGATWNETQGGVTWATPGGAFEPTVAASVTHGPSDDTGWDAFDIASIVQKWVSGQVPNLGLLLKLNDETPTPGNWFAYASGDYTDDPSWRPKVSITYTDDSHAQGPVETISSPAQGDLVSGTQTVTAAASDDSHVAKVDFLVDGAVKATDTTAPFSMSWSTTTATNASHSLTARATDDAGNVTTSPATSVTVDNTTLPATNVTAPLAGATVSGSTVTVSASASGGRPISHVEFYVDSTRLADDTTSPYSVTWNTLDQTVPSYDGAHVLTAKAYDSVGRVVTSRGVTVTTANATGKFKAGFSTTAVPQAVTYDPSATTQETDGVDVTVTNTSSTTWLASDVVLRYRWYSPDALPVVTDGPDIPLTTDLPAGQSTTLRALVNPPALPAGVSKAQYDLRFDLYSKTSAAWFADNGNPPNDNPVIVNKALMSDALGLERFWAYEQQPLGAGMLGLVNVANGNLLVHASPWSEPGRGLATVLGITYNSLEDHSDSPVGNNWSLSLSTLTRLGQPLDIHPNQADTISGRSNKWIQFTDGDGTPHRFDGTTNANGTTSWTAPPGVHLYLRSVTTDTTASRYWGLSRPDHVTFYYDHNGFPTAVVDANGNALTIVESAVPPGDDPGGPKQRVTAVTDAGGRSVTLAYYGKSDAKSPHVRGNVEDVVDHGGHRLHFDYYDDGNLLRLTQIGGHNADGSYLADRSWVFTYTNSAGDAAAIPTASARVNPDPRTPNESAQLFSIRDPRGHETTVTYYGPGSSSTLRWRLNSLTNRGGSTTSFTYDTTNLTTTVTDALTHVTTYAYDGAGKPTTLTDAKGRVTSLAWTADYMVSKLTEPNQAHTDYTYNANGYVTSITDQLGHTTNLGYDDRPLDATDTGTHWSLLTSKTDPLGDVWRFGYDAAGDLTSTTEPGQTASASYGYDSYGQLLTAKSPNGGTTSYAGYDANGLPQTVTDPLGRVTTNGFDADGLQLWTQTPSHAGDSGTDTRSYRTYFDYDSFHRLGRQSEPKSTSSARGLLVWTDRAFDPNDNVISERNPVYGNDDPGTGPTTTYAFDAMDQPTLQTGPDTSADSLGERTKYGYDAVGNLTTVTDPRSMKAGGTNPTAVNGYDELDRVVSQKVNDINPTTGAVTSSRTSYACYDMAGNVAAQYQPLAGLTAPPATCPAATAANAATHTTLYAYDLAHRLTTTIEPLRQSTAAARTTTDAYDNAGRRVSHTDEAGKTTTYGYDGRGLTTRVDEPFNGTRKLTTLIDYDADGNRIREVSPRGYDISSDKTTFTDFVTRYSYDAADELRVTIEPTGNDSRGDPTPPAWVYDTYDPDGRLASESLPVGIAPSSTNPLNPSSALSAVALTSTSYWDTGWVRTEDTAPNPTVRYDYTPEGWQSQRTPDPQPGQPAAPELWQYYPDGQLQARTDTAGHTATFGYDPDDQLTTATSNIGVTDSSQPEITVGATYDGYGELTKTTSLAGSDNYDTYSTYAYDADGNLTARNDNGKETVDSTKSGGQTAAPDRNRFFYDGADWLTSEYDLGTTTACANDQHVTATYGVTALETQRTIGRTPSTCTAESTSASGYTTRQTSKWTYFDNGKLKTLQVLNAGGNVLQTHTVGYDDPTGVYNGGTRTSDKFSLNGPGSSTCTGSTPTCTESFVYDARGKLVYHDNGHGTTTTYALDGTPTSCTTPDASILAGNVTKETRSPGPTITRCYDGNQQRAQAPSAGEQTKYWYDDLGRLLCITSSAALNDNACQHSDNAPNDSTLRQINAYDYLDNLISVRRYDTTGTKTDTATYVYDALGRVYQEKETHTKGAVADRTTTFTYLGLTNQSVNDHRTGTNNCPGGPTSLTSDKNYLYDAYGHRISLADRSQACGQSSQPTSPTIYDYGYDVHGSIGSLNQDSNASASATAVYSYDPYGQEDDQINPDPTKEISKGDPLRNSSTSNGTDLNNDPLNAFRFADERYDTGSQTLDMGTRRLDIGSGRFMQQDLYRGALDDLDLATDPLNQNRYAMAGANPVGYAETDGHRWAIDGGGGTTTRATAPTDSTSAPRSPSSAPKEHDGGSSSSGSAGESAAVRSARAQGQYYSGFSYHTSLPPPRPSVPTPPARRPMPSIAGLLCGGSLHLICIGSSEDKASPGYQEGVQLGPGLTPVEGEARAAGEAAGAERAGGEGLQAERAAEDASGAADAAAEGLREASALPKGGVYTLRDPETGAVVRTGRSNDLAARERAHASDPVLGDYAFHVEYRTNDYAEQRGLEQILYERYPEAMLENGGFNKIRGISPLNPKGPEYMEAAEDYLARLEGG